MRKGRKNKGGKGKDDENDGWKRIEGRRKKELGEGGRTF